MHGAERSFNGVGASVFIWDFVVAAIFELVEIFIMGGTNSENAISLLNGAHQLSTEQLGLLHGDINISLGPSAPLFDETVAVVGRGFYKSVFGDQQDIARPLAPNARGFDLGRGRRSVGVDMVHLVVIFSDSRLQLLDHGDGLIAANIDMDLCPSGATVLFAAVFDNRAKDESKICRQSDVTLAARGNADDDIGHKNVPELREWLFDYYTKIESAWL